MEQEKIKAYYQIWSEAWKYFRKWAMEFNDSDEYWKLAMKEAVDFYDRYASAGQGRFAKEIILNILEELETAAKERGKEV